MKHKISAKAHNAAGYALATVAVGANWGAEKLHKLADASEREANRQFALSDLALAKVAERKAKEQLRREHGRMSSEIELLTRQVEEFTQQLEGCRDEVKPLIESRLEAAKAKLIAAGREAYDFATTSSKVELAAERAVSEAERVVREISGRAVVSAATPAPEPPSVDGVPPLPAEPAPAA